MQNHKGTIAMSFTNQKPRIATKKDIHANWNCGKNGKYFRCHLCGYKFIEGDYWRCVLGSSKNLTNFLVCKKCDGEDVLDKWEKANKEAKGRFWWVNDNDS